MLSSALDEIGVQTAALTSAIIRPRSSATQERVTRSLGSSIVSGLAINTRESSGVTQARTFDLDKSKEFF
jgi:hypothetical protein